MDGHVVNRRKSRRSVTTVAMAAAFTQRRRLVSARYDERAGCVHCYITLPNSFRLLAISTGSSVSAQ